MDQFGEREKILKILTSDVIAAALDVDIEQITPAKVIELMEEHGLGNKTSRQGLKDILKQTNNLPIIIQQSIPA